MKKIVIALLVITVIFQSCESFLEEEPKFTLTDKNSVTDYQKAKAAVGGIYTMFQNDDWSGKLYLAQASKSGMYKSHAQEYDMSYRESDFSSHSIWRSFYLALNAANFAIKGLEDLEESKYPTRQHKEQLVAEAKILRAWVNLNILWNFGHWWAEDNSEYGLVYRDEQADLSNVQQPRITVGKSYEKIVDDLNYGIEHGPEFNSPRYVSKTFAQALKAKMLLYKGVAQNRKNELEGSLKLVNEILASSGSSFAMESKLEEVYNKAWDSNEVLFARYLENNGSRTIAAGYNYPNGLVYAGNRLPLPPGGELTAGVTYGLDWFSEDPRWPIITGEVRAGETWDDSYFFTFKKLARLGKIAGPQANPIDEKYAAYYFRYPELYIMNAELLARLGASVDEAIEPINVMRSKRISPVLPAVKVTTKEELMEVIFREWVAETFLENGSEFFASLRFEKNGKKYIEEIKQDVVFEQNRICYPIPYDEMLSNKLISQNPGLN